MATVISVIHLFNYTMHSSIKKYTLADMERVSHRFEHAMQYT